MGSTDVTASRAEGLTLCQKRGFIVAIGLGLLLAIGGLAALVGPRREPSIGAMCRLNPNTASSASLARLPGIGLTRASAIVAYRERIHSEEGLDMAFTCPEDLQKVKGIGPHTAEEMAPWLDFGASGEGDEPPSPDSVLTRSQ